MSGRRACPCSTELQPHPCWRYKANLLKRPRRGVEGDGDKDAASSSDSDAPISRAGKFGAL
jgi:hypothetical protein